MTDQKGKSTSFHVFVDIYPTGDKVSRMSQTWIIMFCNREPIMWFIKKKNLVQTSTFVSEFTATKIAVEMTQYLRYKLRMFGVTINEPTNMYFVNEAVYKNTTIPESVFSKNHKYCYYHMCRKPVASEIGEDSKGIQVENFV